ncbi:MULTISPECIES: hypothetical protein [Streptomyces]|uniref:Uncharacterized protein n=2 Tax=Streptomyces TaxID=1883 RepID=A0ABV9J8M4_9ACTN
MAAAITAVMTAATQAGIVRDWTAPEIFCVIEGTTPLGKYGEGFFAVLVELPRADLFSLTSAVVFNGCSAMPGKEVCFRLTGEEPQRTSMRDAFG